MYGDERCTKDRSDDNDELHVGLYAVECENKGGVPELVEQAIEVSAFLHRV